MREELKHQLELSEKINSENNSLLRSKTELSMKLETVESEMNELNDIILELKEEKINLEKTLLEMQKTSSAFHEEKNDLLRDLDYQKSSVSNLQGMCILSPLPLHIMLAKLINFVSIICIFCSKKI